jgi:hypothetical protein
MAGKLSGQNASQQDSQHDNWKASRTERKHEIMKTVKKTDWPERKLASFQA